MMNEERDREEILMYVHNALNEIMFSVAAHQYPNAAYITYDLAAYLAELSTIPNEERRHGA